MNDHVDKIRTRACGAQKSVILTKLVRRVFDFSKSRDKKINKNLIHLDFLSVHSWLIESDEFKLKSSQLAFSSASTIAETFDGSRWMLPICKSSTHSGSDIYDVKIMGFLVETTPQRIEREDGKINPART